jgi:hypothetical protein
MYEPEESLWAGENTHFKEGQTSADAVCLGGHWLWHVLRLRSRLINISEKPRISIKEIVSETSIFYVSELKEWLEVQFKTFYSDGIWELDCWTRCLEKQGDYVEKYDVYRAIILSKLTRKLSLIFYLPLYFYMVKIVYKDTVMTDSLIWICLMYLLQIKLVFIT